MQITVKWVVWVMWKTHHCQFTVIPDAIHWQITQSGANHCQFTSDLQEITWGKWFWGRGFIYHRRHLGSMAGSQPLMILNDSQWSPLAHGAWGPLWSFPLSQFPGSLGGAAKPRGTRVAPAWHPRGTRVAGSSRGGMWWIFGGVVKQHLCST